MSAAISRLTAAFPRRTTTYPYILRDVHSTRNSSHSDANLLLSRSHFRKSEAHAPLPIVRSLTAERRACEILAVVRALLLPKELGEPTIDGRSKLSLTS